MGTTQKRYSAELQEQLVRLARSGRSPKELSRELEPSEETIMCRVLEVSASGYYAWRQRMMSIRAREDEQLQHRIRTIHLLSRQTYGAPRIRAELRDEGTRVSRKRVARLMNEANLRGVSRRKSTVTTRRDRSARPAPDFDFIEGFYNTRRRHSSLAINHPYT